MSIFTTKVLLRPGVLLVLGVLFAVFVPASPAHAEGRARSRMAAVVAAIERVDKTLIESAADVPADESGALAIDVSVGGVDVEVSTDPANGISLAAGRGAVNVALPYADRASEAIAAAPGVVVYDNNNGSATSPIVHRNGSVQINTFIGSPDAPTSYRYEIDLPSGARIERVGDSLLFVHEDIPVGGLAPAWAKDALGKAVPTHYAIDGNTVTQVVEHDADDAYPVVADPWLGINLFKSITVDTYKSQPRVNLNLSAWNKNSTVRAALNKASMRQQFECHALGALFAGQWNLEKFRPNRSAHWSYGVSVHHCNWTTANRY